MPDKHTGKTPRKRIFLLIGPKGSGKTFIGTALKRELGLHFMRVEDIALQTKKERKVGDAEYIREVFQAIEEEVRRQLSHRRELVFESTGLTDAFDQMLERLRNDYEVVLIRIKTDPDRCLERVRSRDQSVHIAVSDDQVLAINALATQKRFDFAGEIDNNGATMKEIVQIFERIRKG